MEKLLRDEEPPSSLMASAPNPNFISHINVATSVATYQPPKPKIQSLDKRRTSRFRVSKSASQFLKKFYPAASRADWNDWRWQNRNRVRSLEELERIVNLSADERAAIERHHGALPVGITPYYASLIDGQNTSQGLRRTVIPVLAEYEISAGENDDPLGEDSHSPVPGLVHRYPDRVLLLVTNFCSVYCRYCTRARMVGSAGERSVKKSDIEASFDYIREHKEIRDVLISGGDPLSLDDEKLEYVLSNLRAIPHVEFIRIGTKQPIVQPMRITPALTRMLKRFHPLWMSLHFTHPDELTPEVVEACGRLADAGIPLGSQTVLLKGVNDNVETMTKLMHGLLKARVKPYYLYQCDPITGSAHFRTPVSKGVEIIRAMRGFTTGYAIPTFVVDAPNGGGKIPIAPDYVVGYENEELLLKSYDGETYRYPDSGLKLPNYPQESL
ncbi:MAG: lysine 2,3-aminomutase [Candidatus Azotimanducaceae bacterium]|jgi:lysine 2,3-aminomutase